MKGTSRKAVLGRMKTSVPIRMPGAGWQQAHCLLEGDMNRVCAGSSSQGAQGLSVQMQQSSKHLHPVSQETFSRILAVGDSETLLNYS